MDHNVDPAYKSYLGIKVVNEGELQGIRTPTGMVKTANGALIATPIADDPKPQGNKAVTQQQERKRRGKAKADNAVAEAQPPVIYEPPERLPVRVEISVGALGTVPSQYVHCLIGNRTAVLGCNMYSFIPAVAKQGDDGTLEPVISLNTAPGREYIYLGQTFTDRDDVLNVILNEITPTGKES